MNGRFIYCAWLYCWLLACAVLQVRADFTQSDSSVLADIATDVDAMRGLLNSQQGDVGAIADSLGLLLTSWDNTIPYIKDDTAYIPYVASTLDNLEHLLRYHLGGDTPGDTAAYATLRNIEANTEATAETVIDIKDNLVLSISNGVAQALAGIPLAYAAATNVVDLTIVTNVADFLVGGSNLPYVNNSNFVRYLAYLFGASETDISVNFEYYLANTPLGFITYLWASALLPTVARDPYGVETSWPFINNSVGLWSGIGSDWEAEYTYFDAYNTLGISNILERANSEGGTVWNINRELSLMHTNFQNFAFVITNNVTAVANNVVNIKNSIGYDENSSVEEELDYEPNGRLPEWEPEYHSQVESWTNVYFYDNLFRASVDHVGTATDVVNQAFGQFKRGDKDFHDKLTWSGVDLGTGQGPIGGWDLDVNISSDDAHYSDVRDLTKQCFAFFFAVLDLCVVVFFSRRIFMYLMSTGMNAPGASS